MATYTVGEFKAKFSDILEYVKSGKEVAISYGKARKVVAYLKPANNPPKKNRTLGSMKKKKIKFDGNWDLDPTELFD